MGPTGFCKNLQFPAVFCKNLRFPVVFCENLLLPETFMAYAKPDFCGTRNPTFTAYEPGALKCIERRGLVAHQLNNLCCAERCTVGTALITVLIPRNTLTTHTPLIKRVVHHLN